jgi:hypothetical protein
MRAGRLGLREFVGVERRCSVEVDWGGLRVGASDDDGRQMADGRWARKGNATGADRQKTVTRGDSSGRDVACLLATRVAARKC